jgi:hypothetical protein
MGHFSEHLSGRILGPQLLRIKRQPPYTPLFLHLVTHDFREQSLGFPTSTNTETRVRVRGQIDDKVYSAHLGVKRPDNRVFGELFDHELEDIDLGRIARCLEPTWRSDGELQDHVFRREDGVLYPTWLRCRYGNNVPVPLSVPHALLARVSRYMEHRRLTHDAGYLAQSRNHAPAIKVCCNCRSLVEIRVLLVPRACRKLLVCVVVCDFPDHLNVEVRSQSSRMQFVQECYLRSGARLEERRSGGIVAWARRRSSTTWL